MKTLTENELLLKASAYCAHTERCPSEVKAKLRQWGVEDESAPDRIVERLKEEGYIDELRYCRAFSADKFRFNRWGRQKILCALLQKGLPRTLIEEALSDITDEDSLLSARTLLSAKLKTLRTANGYELYVRLMRFAASRGIEPEVARRAIEELDIDPD